MKLTKSRFAQWHLARKSDYAPSEDERGSVLPLLIGFLAITLATVALVINVGYVRSQHLMLVTAAEEVAIAGAQGINPVAAVDSLTGEAGERLSLDESQVRLLAKNKASDLASGWKRLRLESVVVKSRAAVVRLCVNVRLPLTVALPGAPQSDSQLDAQTMCTSAAAALALSPPQ